VAMPIAVPMAGGLRFAYYKDCQRSLLISSDVDSEQAPRWKSRTAGNQVLHVDGACVYIRVALVSELALTAFLVSA
jgi:hypothetical protein